MNNLYSLSGTQKDSMDWKDRQTKCPICGKSFMSTYKNQTSGKTVFKHKKLKDRKYYETYYCEQ